MRNRRYSDLVKELKSASLADPRFSRSLNELISVNELLTTLNQAKTLEQRLDIIMLTLLGHHGCFKGAIYVKGSQQWTLNLCKGMRSCKIAPSVLPMDDSWDALPNLVQAPTTDPALAQLFEEGDFEVVLPARNEGKLVGLLCLGKSRLQQQGEDKLEILSIIADFGGVIIGNNLYHDDLEQMNKRLQRQLFKLNTLYELTGSFARCYEEEAVFQILSNNLMGQFFISRSAILSLEHELRLVFRKGLKHEGELLGHGEWLPLNQWCRGVCSLAEVPCPSISAFMTEHKLEYALPIAREGCAYYLLLLGPRMDRRKLSPEDLDFIQSLCEQAAAALDNVRLQKEMLEKKRMEKELQLAREIQQKLLPKDVPILTGYELAAEMRAFNQVGGDFYDFIPLDDGRLAFCLADVSGKSLPASMIMSTAQASLRALNSFAGLSPCEVIEKLNRHMYRSTASNKFITMFYAVLDPLAHELHYINCGHNRPILVSPNQEISLLGLGGMVLGMFPMAKYQVGMVPFTPGTELLIYSDGLSEVINGEGEEFGDERLAERLVALRGQGTVVEEKDHLVNEVMEFSCNEMVDDMTLVLIRRNGG